MFTRVSAKCLPILDVLEVLHSKVPLLLILSKSVSTKQGAHHLVHYNKLEVGIVLTQSVKRVIVLTILHARNKCSAT